MEPFSNNFKLFELFEGQIGVGKILGKQNGGSRRSKMEKMGRKDLNFGVF
jgi:hypothetical protein